MCLLDDPGLEHVGEVDEGCNKEDTVDRCRCAIPRTCVFPSFGWRAVHRKKVDSRSWLSEVMEVLSNPIADSTAPVIACSIPEKTILLQPLLLSCYDTTDQGLKNSLQVLASN